MNKFLEKRLILESSILHRDENVRLITDITACYDQHIAEISEVILKTYGVPHNRASILMKNFKEIKTKIQTIYGILKESYRSTNNEVYYRIDQCNIVS